MRIYFSFRNYHVFYYLLAGASEQERVSFGLSQPQDYFYLNQVKITQPISPLCHKLRSGGYFAPPPPPYFCF